MLELLGVSRAAGLRNARRARELLVREREALGFGKGGDESMLKESLVRAAKQLTLHRVPLYDLLWDYDVSPQRREARLAVVVGLIRALVEQTMMLRDPVEEGKSAQSCSAGGGPGGLADTDKALLRFLMRMTMGPPDLTHDPREGYRAALKEVFGSAMRVFEGRLSTIYGSLAGVRGGPELLTLPATRIYVDDARMVHQCPSGLFWATSRSMRRAYAALQEVGAIHGVGDLSQLMSNGRHQFMGSVHPVDFEHLDSPKFWGRLVVLYLIAACKRAQPAFRAACKKVADGISGAKWQPGELKKYERSWIKTEEYILEKELAKDGDRICAAGYVVDMMRGSITVHSAEDALVACRAIEASKDWVVLKSKNGFHESAESMGGYRDIKYIVRMRGQAPLPGASQRQAASGSSARSKVACAEHPNVDDLARGGPTGEIQVLLSEYLAVKKSMHSIYTAARGDFDHAKWRTAP